MESIKFIICIIFTFCFTINLSAQQSTTGPFPPKGCDKGKVNIYSKGQVLLSDFPTYLWQHGCGPTALGMVIGYYDSQGFSDLIPGNATYQTNEVNNAIANSDHYNDYSLPLDEWPGPLYPDASEIGTAHSSNCIADFMRTSWSSEDNYYGWSWSNHVDNAFTGYINLINSNYHTTTEYENYSDATSWDLFKEEIDNERPVVLLVDTDGDGDTDHFVPGIGYDDTTNEYAIYDTWDNNIHWYEWREISSGVSWGIWGFNILRIERVLDLKVMLEGPFNGIDMNTNLNSILPINQPFNSPPWNYAGTEIISSIPTDIVDWILLELYDATDALSISEISLLERKAALINSYGQIVDVDGSDLPILSTQYSNNLYVILRHRNHLDVISSVGLTNMAGVLSYDFTNSEVNALGGAKAHKYLGNNVWGMIAADANADNQINNLDKDDVLIYQYNLSGYLSGDLNMDGLVNDADMYNYWENNAGLGNQKLDELPLLCGYELIDDRDGQNYLTVQIGDQCWMAKSINIGDMINGSNNQSNDEIFEKYCYGNSEISCDTYGGLYQWNEMMQYATNEGAQGICPSGWHVPTDDEWKILEGNVDSQFGVGDPEWDGSGYRGLDAGKNLKANSGWSNSGNGIDLYGFKAIPGGVRNTGGSFDNFGTHNYLWTSTQYDSDDAVSRYLISGSEKIYRFGASDKSRGRSVRCLKD